MNGFYYQVEGLDIDDLPGLVFSGWLEIEHDHIDGWYVLNVWLDNGQRNITCPAGVAEAIKKQAHADDSIMGQIDIEGREHNE